MNCFTGNNEALSLYIFITKRLVRLLELIPQQPPQPLFIYLFTCIITIL